MGAKFNPALDDETLDQSHDDWRGGVDEFQTPTKLPPGTGAKLVNAIVEDNGRPRTRPGADALGGAALDAGQRIDCLTYFDTPTVEKLYAAVNQSLREWDGAAWATISGYPFGGNNIIAMAQGHNRLYASSGTGQWFSFDGTAWNAGEGTAATSPPVGASMMVWHKALRIMFAAGTIGGNYDVLQSSIQDSASAGAGKWSDATWSVRIGRGEGERITAICPGKGFWLAVGKEGSIYMVLAEPGATSAAEWEIPLLAGSVGCVGRRAMCEAGGNIFVVGPDLSLREILPQSGAVRTGDAPFELGPTLSEPAKPYFERINEAAMDKIVLHKYGRYLLCALPLDSASEPSHVLAWDLRRRVASASGAGGIPTFIGSWTGWTPTVMATTRFAGAERLVIGDSAGMVNEWKDAEDQELAATFADNDTDVLMMVRSPSWEFGTRRNFKDPESVEVEFINSTPLVDVLAVLDEAEQARWPDVETENVSNELPVNLPFDLAVLGTTRSTKQADHLVEFKEAYVEVQQQTRGRLELRSMAMSAFVNTTSQE